MLAELLIVMNVFAEVTLPAVFKLLRGRVMKSVSQTHKVFVLKVAIIRSAFCNRPFRPNEKGCFLRPSK